MKVIRGIGRWFVQHINLVLLILVLLTASFVRK